MPDGGFDIGAVDPSLAGYFGGGPMLPQVAQLAQADPRRMLVQSMMQQGQQSLERPTLSPGAALAKALTIGLGGASSAYLNHQYQDMNTSATKAMQDAMNAPDIATRMKILQAGGPATMQMAWQQQQMIQQHRATLDAQAAKDHLVNVWGDDPWTPIAQHAIQGGGEAVAAIERPKAEATEGGKLDAQGSPGGLKTAQALSDIAQRKDIAVGAANAGAQGEQARLTQSGKMAGTPAKVTIGGIDYQTTEEDIARWRQGQQQSPLPNGVSPGNTPAPTTRAPVATPAPAQGKGATPTAGTPAAGAPKVQPAMPPKAAGPGATPAASPGAAGDAGAAGAATPPPGQNAPSGPPNASQQGPGGLPTLGAGTPANIGRFQKLIDNDSDEVAKERLDVNAGRKDMKTIQAIDDFLPTVRTGWNGPALLKAGLILQSLGVDDGTVQEFTHTNPANGQLLTKQFLQLSSAAVRGMGAREPGSVISLFQGAYPNIGTDEPAITLQNNMLRMDQLLRERRVQAKGEFLRQSVNDVGRTGDYRGLNGFDQEFDKDNLPRFYQHAAEAISGRKEAWQGDPAEFNKITAVLPIGTRFMRPDGQWVTKDR